MGVVVSTTLASTRTENVWLLLENEARETSNPQVHHDISYIDTSCRPARFEISKVHLGLAELHQVGKERWNMKAPKVMNGGADPASKGSGG